jgi:acyl-CoA synthetase (AMP-forming)/AMP-acid ligase II
MMTLLAYSTYRFTQKVVLNHEGKIFTYKTLFEISRKVCTWLYQEHQIQYQDKIGIFYQNKPEIIQSIFALAYLGADIYLLNADMSKEQLLILHQKHNFKAILIDTEQYSWQSDFSIPLIHLALFDSTKPLSIHRTPKSYRGKLIVLTGGTTTGAFKTIPHQTSVTKFIYPTHALIKKLNLVNYHSVYIAVPIFHSYGFSTLLISILLGKKVFISTKFHTQKAIDIIEKNAIEVATFVPTMLHRIIQEKPYSLKSVRCIISGAAPLAISLAKQTQQILGNVLYNLYGSSEAGFCIIATPLDLQKHIATIGKPIEGVKAFIHSPDTQGIGELCIRSKWTFSDKNWIHTGDLAQISTDGFIFLHGRVDDMIISGGENIYSSSIENIILQHHDISEVAVIGIPDKEFGQVVKAFIVIKPHTKVCVEELKTWLTKYLARFAVPKMIEIVDVLPRTSLGKINKKLLH